MKTWNYGQFDIILLENERCKCLHIVDNLNKELCGWLDFDGFAYNRQMLVSGVQIVEKYQIHQGLFLKLIRTLEEIYLANYEGYDIKITILNPKVKRYIKRVKKLSMFNNANILIKEEFSSILKFSSGQLPFPVQFVFDILTEEKIELLQQNKII